jgi:hypothetical protein
MDYEKKQMISELQAINDELKLIDFMRKYFLHEFAEIFDKETEEIIKEAQEKVKYCNMVVENFDIRKYTFFLLHYYIPAEYSINNFYVRLDYLKVIIFYEHIICLNDNWNTEKEERNRKNEEKKQVYNFFKALISNGKCEMKNHTNAIRILNMTRITQNELDEDKYRIRRETYAKCIYDTVLYKYIDEYKNYL